MLTDRQKCRHCRGKMSSPKAVLDGPSRGKYRTFCMACGHIEFVAGMVDEQGDMASQPQVQSAHVAAGGPTLVLRNGQWEIN